MVFDDGAAEREADAHAVALGAHEGLEEPFNDVLRQARSGVGHADPDRARGGGQAGELILAARHLVVGDQKLSLRSFKAGTGRSRTGASVATSVAAGPLGLFVRGGNIELPAGTLITAQLREDTSLPVVPEPGPAAPQAEPDQPEIQQETPGETIR